MFGKLRNNKKGYVGIQLTSTQIRMVELSGEPSQPVVEHFAVLDIPNDVYNGNDVQDQPRLGELIKAAFSKGGFSRKNVAIALPSNLVITKEFLLPVDESTDQMGLVEQEVANNVPLDLDEIYIDYKILGPTDNDELLQAAYAVSKKQHVDEYVGALEIAGLVTKIVDTDHNAMLHAVDAIAQFQKGGCEDENVMSVSIGHEKTEYMVFRNEKLIWVREHYMSARTLQESLSATLGMDSDEANAIIQHPQSYTEQYPNLETDVLQPFVDGLAMEVMRHIEMFNEESSTFGIQHIWLSGEGAHLGGLEETILARTSVESEIVNPLGHCQLGSKVSGEELMDIAPLLMVATGMALRTFE